MKILITGTAGTRLQQPIELWSNKVIDEKIDYLPVPVRLYQPGGRSGGHPSKSGRTRYRFQGRRLSV
jgi:hypothetical protein